MDSLNGFGTEYAKSAETKLREQVKKGGGDKYVSVVLKSTVEALVGFCYQSEKFAKAVLDQKGTVAEACQAALKNRKGSGISDLDMYRGAVQFYFPSAQIDFQMNIVLAQDVESERKEKKAIVLNLLDF